MKRLTLFILGGAMLSSIASARDADSEFKAFMKATLPKLANAFNTKNAKFFEDISTADFVEKTGGQTMNRAQALAEMKSEFASIDKMNCTFKLLSSSVKGNTGIAMTSGKATMTTKAVGKEKAHTMTLEMWGKETWVRVGKTWKVKMLDEAKPTKMTMDGKPYKMGSGH